MQSEIQEARMRTARHEAAHALCGWFFGEKIAFLTTTGPEISVDGFDEKTPNYCKFDHRERENTDDAVVSLAAHALAPIVLQEVAGAEKTGWHDSKTVTDYLGFGKVRNGGRSMVNYCHDNFDNPDLPQKFFEKFKGHAQEILDDPRAMVALDSLAAKLLKDGKVSGRQAAETLERAWEKPLPEKALPIQEHSPPFGFEEEKISLTVAVMDVEYYLNRAIESIRWAVTASDREEEAQERLLKSLLQVKFDYGT